LINFLGQGFQKSEHYRQTDRYCAIFLGFETYLWNLKSHCNVTPPQYKLY